MTVPPAPSVSAHDVTRLVELLRGRRVVALAGAGCSTESGIPDYRGPEGRLKKHTPVQFGEFVRSQPARRRYWSRSAIGWRRVAEAAPNEAHRGLAELEALGRLSGLITQNVDGLHQAAGSRRVMELHGSLAWVVCLDCGHRTRRADMQDRLEEANREWWLWSAPGGAGRSHRAVPDGDAELPEGAADEFVVPACERCAGVLKPDVVFFGENVPKDRVDTCWQWVRGAEVLLVVGSSLTVFSGRRFVDGAHKDSKPIAVVNLGPTRADGVAAAKVEGRLGDVLPKVVARLATT